MYTLALTKDEFLYLLVLYGVEDDDKYREYGLNLEDTTSERLARGEELLRTREIVTGKTGIPTISDEATAIVGTSIIQKKEGNEYIDSEVGLHVRVLREGEVYLFRGELVEKE